MKYIVTESQYNLIKEYFDPIYFLKNKFGKKLGQVKDPNWVPYEGKFQEVVDVIFKLTKKMNKIEHLNGFKVSKVTPMGDDYWTVLLVPEIDDWFNWKENSQYRKKLEEFRDEFLEIARMGGFDSPHSEEGLPSTIRFAFWFH